MPRVRWNVYAIGHVTNGDLARRPAWKEVLKNAPTHFPVQTTHTVYTPAAANGEISHIERFLCIRLIRASQGQYLLDIGTEFVSRVRAEVSLDQLRRKTIKAGRHRHMGRKHVPRPRNGHGDIERQAGIPPQRPRALEDGERRVSFVEMTDFGTQSKRMQQPPTTDAQQQLLHEAFFWSAPVQLTDDPALGRLPHETEGIE
jgi:hypothetical protein